MEEAIIILGAGVAGMAAAKLLAGGGHRVVLVDRSFSPVAQAGHLHVLLGRGQQLLGEQFPEVYRRICAECPEVNWGDEIYWRSPAGPLPKRALDVSTRLLGRAYLDRLLAEELENLPGCELVTGSIQSLKLSPDRSLVTSVTLADGRELGCSHCIDSLGRGSRTRQQLESLFSVRVRTDEIRTALRYFSFDARLRGETEFRQVYYQIDPQTERFGGVISPVGGDRLIATFISIDRDFQPAGNPFHLIPDEVFQRFVDQVEFAPGHRAFGQLHNRRHRYEKFRQLPSNLFLIGDSFCQFNPVFGQGMTVALESAALLAKFVSGAKTGSGSLGFQAQLARSIRFPWMISTMDPYNQDAGRNWSQRATRALMHRVMGRCRESPETHRSLVRALHMLDHPRELLKLRNLI